MQHQQCGLSAPTAVLLATFWRTTANNWLTGELFSPLGRACNTRLAYLSLYHHILSFQALLICHASRDQDWQTHIQTHTAQSISTGPTLQLRDKWCRVSAGFCVKLCSLSAVCRTALWRPASPNAMKRCGKRKAEEGLKVLRLVLIYDHKDSELPNQS